MSQMLLAIILFILLVITVLFFYYFKKNKATPYLGFKEKKLSSDKENINILENSTLNTEANPIHTIVSSITKHTQSVNSPEIKEKDISIFSVYASYSEGRYIEGDEAFMKLNEKLDDVEKKQKNEIVYHTIRHEHGFTVAFNAIKNVISTTIYSSVKAFGYHSLASIKVQNNDFKNAISLYKESLKFINSDILPDTYKGLMTCYYNLGEDIEAKQILINAFNDAEDENLKHKILTIIAEYYQLKQDHLKRGLFLQYAQIFNANDIDTIFNTAYAFSETKYKTLSLINYDILLKTKNKHTWGLNNIGVALDQLGLKNKGIEYYFKSLETNNTLAAANLAFKFIDAGFYRHAKELLENAMKADEVHDNVHAARNSLVEKEKEEENKYLEYLNEAKKQQTFLRNVAEVEMGNCVVDFEKLLSIGWYIDNVKLSVSQNNYKASAYNFKWSDWQNKYNVSLDLEKQSGYASLSKQPNTGVAESIDGFFYMTNNEEEINILVTENLGVKPIYYKFIGSHV